MKKTRKTPKRERELAESRLRAKAAGHASPARAKASTQQLLELLRTHDGLRVPCIKNRRDDVFRQ